MDLTDVAREMNARLSRLEFGPPTAFVYNPLEYAWAPYARYVEKYASDRVEVLLVGMNPGPFGMAQTGVPFGDATKVRQWLKISGPVGRPAKEHPKRRIEGFSCRRSEVSGSRLWGWAEARFSEPERFFSRFFVANYCPLVFMEESGRNRTPDKLPASEKTGLFKICDWGLEKTVHVLSPRYVLGIGAFAETRCKEVLNPGEVQIGRILHPSPASPKANRGWAAEVETRLRSLGIDLP